MNIGKNASPSPFARSVGAAAASLVAALFVCAFTYFLRALDFAPLRALVTTTTMRLRNGPGRRTRIQSPLKSRTLL
jgi:hypothetical protein